MLLPRPVHLSINLFHHLADACGFANPSPFRRPCLQTARGRRCEPLASWTFNPTPWFLLSPRPGFIRDEQLMLLVWYESCLKAFLSVYLFRRTPCGESIEVGGEISVKGAGQRLAERSSRLDSIFSSRVSLSGVS